MSCPIGQEGVVWLEQRRADGSIFFGLTRLSFNLLGRLIFFLSRDTAVSGLAQSDCYWEWILLSDDRRFCHQRSG